MSSFAHSWKTSLAVTAGAAAIIAMTVQPANAADAPKKRAAQLQAIVDCRTVADAAQRLACYDGAVAGLDAAEKAGDVVVVDREQVKEAQRAAFGFNFRMPSFMSGGGGGESGAAEEKFDTLDSTIATVRQVGGKWTFTLPDGAIWQQTDSEVIARTPKVGSKVSIRKGAAGGFFISIDGQRSVRAKRQN